jgi:hypothetical protein
LEAGMLLFADSCQLPSDPVYFSIYKLKIDVKAGFLSNRISDNDDNYIRTHLKNRILFQGQGDLEFQPAGILLYFEELKREKNTEIGTKDIFEIGYR